MLRFRWLAAFVPASLFFAPGCGDDTTNPVPPPPGDTAAPFVTVLRPTHDAIMGTTVHGLFSAADASGVDSVWVSVRNGGGAEVRRGVFTSPPYEIDIPTNDFLLGVYSICARARDLVGNRSDWVCETARVYPPYTLRFDDDTAEFGIDPGIPTQTAVVFTNPYDVPITVDLVRMYFYQGPLSAPYRVAVFGIENGHPEGELDSSPLLHFRGPNGSCSIYTARPVVIPAGEKFAAGLEQLSEPGVFLGYDTSLPTPPGTYYLSVPSSFPIWQPLETVPWGGDSVPMIQVLVHAADEPPGARVLHPTPVRSAGGAPKPYPTSTPWRRLH